jgi:hypothetical protein
MFAFAIVSKYRRNARLTPVIVELPIIVNDLDLFDSECLRDRKYSAA